MAAWMVGSSASMSAMMSRIMTSHCVKPALTDEVVCAAMVLRRASMGRPSATTRSAAASAQPCAWSTTVSSSSWIAMKFAPRTFQCACFPLTASA